MQTFKMLIKIPYLGAFGLVKLGQLISVNGIIDVAVKILKVIAIKVL